MNNLHLTTDTDIVKKMKHTAANKLIQVDMGYGDHSKTIHVSFEGGGDNIILQINDKSQQLLSCVGTVEKGITECQPYNWAGPMPKLQMKR